jgi:hypothetical protein
VGAAPGGNERRRRKNKTKTLKTKSLLCLNYNTNKKLENPNFWGFFPVIIEGVCIIYRNPYNSLPKISRQHPPSLTNYKKSANCMVIKRKHNVR